MSFSIRCILYTLILKQLLIRRDSFSSTNKHKLNLNLHQNQGRRIQNRCNIYELWVDQNWNNSRLQCQMLLHQCIIDATGSIRNENVVISRHLIGQQLAALFPHWVTSTASKLNHDITLFFLQWVVLLLNWMDFKDLLRMNIWTYHSLVFES